MPVQVCALDQTPLTHRRRYQVENPRATPAKHRQPADMMAAAEFSDLMLREVNFAMIGVHGSLSS